MYTDFILKKAPVVLTQIDRDEHSKTYGSCDRNHWHLKIRDFTSTILQQSGLAVALLYNLDFEGNIYYQNENMKAWAEATVRYWCKVQLGDGSFNEYYPWEHGFPPTAFSLYSTCEIYNRLHMQDLNVEEKIKKTARYLAQHIEEKAFNQEIASITGMYSAYKILKEKWILDALQQKLDRVLQLQDEEGWFPEYGGADIGYLSVAFDMLAEYYWMSRDERVREPLERVVAFLKYFVHPDGTIGGEYGSRNTTYFLPNGLEVMSELGSADAEAMLQTLYSGVERNNFFLDSVDDRYLSHYTLHSFLRALEKRLIAGKAPAMKHLPMETAHIKSFPNCGLVTFCQGKFSGVIGMRKGGILKLYQSGKEILVDCGYRVNLGGGTAAGTNWQDPSYECHYEENRFAVSGHFNKIALKTSTPLLHMGLRGVAFLAGNRIIGLLKRRIILVDKHYGAQFERTVELLDHEIRITDKIVSPVPITVELAGNMSLRHVASGKFFMTSDLLRKQNERYESVKDLQIQTIITEKGSIIKNYERLA